MGDVVRYRLAWKQTPWPAVLPGVVFQFLVRQEGDTWLDKLPYALGLAAFGAALCAFARRRWYVELRPEGIVVSGLTRSVESWRAVGAVWVERTLGTSQVRILTPGGVRTPRAPSHTPGMAPDPDFDAKVATIVRYWEQYRGPDWVPPQRPAWAVAAQAGS